MISQFTDFKLIHKGSIADIFSAIEPISQHKVIIKLLRNSNFYDRFIKEIEIISKLDHNNIVRFYSCGTYKNKPYLITEFLNGQTLSEYSKHNYPIKTKECINLILDICSGIQYLHNLGISHQDIKPDNIFICDNKTVKILDFGLSNFVANTNDNICRFITGTIDYVSPEKIIRPQQIKQLDDIYSLGATIYFMLTLNPLYKYKQRDKNIRAKINYTHELTTIEHTIFFNLIKQMLEKPGKRINNLNQVISVIKNYKIIEDFPINLDKGIVPLYNYNIA